MTASRDGHLERASYRELRTVVGVLGFGLPFILIAWSFLRGDCTQIQSSISAYYYCPRTRDVYVGILWTIAWFLFAYKGYARKDDLAGVLAGLCALGTSLFPDHGPGLERVVHLSSALGLFLTLAYFSCCLFTKSRGAMTPRKQMRNLLYRICGAAILACVGAVAVCLYVLKGALLHPLHPVFWLESAALWAFGVSWFVKGGLLLKDR
jgi:hypothetical protein